jgi:diguanylate cyclase (GGDEF)-like protein
MTIKEPSLGLSINLIAGGAAILAALALPLAYFVIGYWHHANDLKAEAELCAGIVAREIGANHGLTRARMEAIQQQIAHRLATDDPKTFRIIINSENRVIDEFEKPLDQPGMTQTVELKDSGRVFGRFEISRSLRPLLFNTGLFGLLGMVIGATAFNLLRAIPLRSLSTALKEIKARKEMQEHLQRSLSMLGATLESTADGILVSDSLGGITRFNQKYIEMWRIPEMVVASEDHNQMLGVVVAQLIDPHNFLKKLIELRGTNVNSGTDSHGILELKDGRTFEWNSSLQQVDGESIGRVWSFHDVTERRQAEVLLAGEKRILEAIINGTPLVDMLGMLARNIEEQSGKMFCSFLLPDEPGQYLFHSAAAGLPAGYVQELGKLPIHAFTDTIPYGISHGLLDIAKEPAWAEWRHLAQSHGLHVNLAAPIISSNGSMLGAIATYYIEPNKPDSHDMELVKLAVNISKIAIERRQTEERLAYLAHYDTLTGLPARALFRDRLAHAMAKAERNGKMMALMFLDLDRFKVINDTLGHGIGDALLKNVAQRLTECVRDEDTVARLGGDEFTVILEQIGNVTDASIVAKKIIDSIALPMFLNSHEVFVTASIGIAVYPLDNVEIDELIKNADSAMYRAKEDGKNSFEFYTKEMNSRTLEHMTMENELRHAMERNEFVLHYQPKVDMKTGHILSMEALLRWEHPSRGTVPPDEFIPFLEESGMITPVGEWVLRTACAQNKVWQNDGFDLMRVAVNLSARQFQQNDIVKCVSDVLRETGLNANFLELEVTESMLMKNPESAIKALQEIKAMGVVRINIDDFGTGYSSLSYLKRFPISTVKIDRSFVNGIPDNDEDIAITRAVIAMAHSLKLNVVAEGVENIKQHAFLLKEKCDEIQGYFFSKPLPATEFTQLLLDHQIVENRKLWQHR